MLAPPAAISIAYNDRPLGVAALEVRGHVLVPMRPLFDAIGAAVTYDAHTRTVRATTATQRVVLTIGDLGSRILDGRTYVPLRFIATSLGANVAYDAETRVVNVTLPEPSPRRAHSRPSAAATLELQPAPDTRVGSAFPTIAASIGAASNLNFGTIRLLVDGLDVTPLASYGPTSIAYIPRSGLRVGSHTVTLNGITTDGAPLDTQWSFETTLPAVPSAASGANGYGGYGYLSGLQLSVAGSVFAPNAAMPVHLIAPPGGAAYAFMCNSPYQYPMYAPPGSSYYSATLQAPLNGQSQQCPISAMYVAQNGQISYSPYPVYVTFGQPPPRPTATPSRHAPGPVQTRPPSTPGAPATPPAHATHAPVATPHPTTKPVQYEPEPRPQPRATPKRP